MTLLIINRISEYISQYHNSQTYDFVTTILYATLSKKAQDVKEMLLISLIYLTGLSMLYDYINLVELK